MFGLFVALCIFGGTLSAVAKLHKEETCEKVEGVKDFNVTRFSGFWYLVQVDGELSESDDEGCPIFDMVFDENDVLRIRNDLRGGNSFIPDKLNPSKFRSTNPKDHSETMIVATDYRSYAVIYSCPIQSYEAISIEIMARTQKPISLELNKTINDVLTKNNFGQRILLSTDLKTCDGIQMVGRGKDEFRNLTVNRDVLHCKPVKGVKDFDLTRFMGSWYEMQTSFQSDRNCGPSNFSLVVNGTRLHISTYDDGYYEVNSRDPASFTKYKYFGKKIHSIVYTVLETDYDSYAISYTCSPSLAPSSIITLTRKNELTDDFRKKIDNALAKNDLGITYLFLNSQSNCDEED